MTDIRIVGIIPAAGKGTRLQPLPIPKELFPIGYQDYPIDGVLHKRPKVISQYVVENMAAAGASRVVFVLGEGKHHIMEYYGAGTRFGLECVYVYQERLSGMPGALDLARGIVDGWLVLFGMPDTVFEPTDGYKVLVDVHRRAGNDVTLGLFPTQAPHKFGMVDFAEDGTIRSIVDKPLTSSLRYMWGTAVWGDKFTRLLGEFVAGRLAERREMLLGDAFTAAIEAGLQVRAHAFADGSYLDIGTAEELDETIRRFHR